jgi:integrase
MEITCIILYQFFTISMKSNVYIRKRRNKGVKANTESLYLDFYPPVELPGRKTKSRRLTLKLFKYINPKKAEEKEHNRKVDQESEIIRARYLQLYGSKSILTNFERELHEQNELSKQSFKAFYQEEMKKRSENTLEQWITFGELNPRLVEEFRTYLLNYESPITKKTIHQNTAQTYFKPFRAALNAAHRYGYLMKDICKQVSDIPSLETKREFLSIDEIKRLIATPCSDDVIRRASIIAIYSGLRHSDMIRLQWSNICEDSEGMHIELRQKKTAGLLHIPIKDTAIHYLGERDADESLVFETLKNKKEYNNVIAEWVQAAGIKKNITFHCFRHSFAMMLLQSGVGIYELSRMLGHKSLTMTQVYLRMLDEDRRKAINKIPI